MLNLKKHFLCFFTVYACNKQELGMLNLKTLVMDRTTSNTVGNHASKL